MECTSVLAADAHTYFDINHTALVAGGTSNNMNSPGLGYIKCRHRCDWTKPLNRKISRHPFLLKHLFSSRFYKFHNSIVADLWFSLARHRIIYEWNNEVFRVSLSTSYAQLFNCVPSTRTTHSTLWSTPTESIFCAYMQMKTRNF